MKETVASPKGCDYHTLEEDEQNAMFDPSYNSAMQRIRTQDKMPQPHVLVIVAGGCAVWTGSVWLSKTGDTVLGRVIEWPVTWWMPHPDHTLQSDPPVKPPSKIALEIAARVWCDQEMKNCVMDTEAAERIARIVDEVRREQCDELGYQGLADCGGLANAP